MTNLALLSFSLLLSVLIIDVKQLFTFSIIFKKRVFTVFIFRNVLYFLVATFFILINLLKSF